MACMLYYVCSQFLIHHCFIHLLMLHHRRSENSECLQRSLRLQSQVAILNMWFVERDWIKRGEKWEVEFEKKGGRDCKMSHDHSTCFLWEKCGWTQGLMLLFVGRNQNKRKISLPSNTKCSCFPETKEKSLFVLGAKTAAFTLVQFSRTHHYPTWTQPDNWGFFPCP